MKTFLLLIMLLNAKTGEPIDNTFEGGKDGKPMTLDECIALTMEKGVQPVKDGVATVYTCFNIGAGSTRT